MSGTTERLHLHLLPLGLSILAFALVTAVLAAGAPDSVAQSSDRDADGYTGRDGHVTAASRESALKPTYSNFAAVRGESGAGDQKVSSAEGSDDRDFPWKVSLLILAGGLVATGIAYVVTGRSKPRPPGTSTKH